MVWILPVPVGDVDEEEDNEEHDISIDVCHNKNLMIDLAIKY